MTITKETLRRLAKFSKLQFNKNEEDDYLKDLNQIILFIKKLDKVDTNGISEFKFVNDEDNPLREDHELKYKNIEKIKLNAPEF